MTCSWVRGSFRELGGGRGFGGIAVSTKAPGRWQPGTLGPAGLGILALSWDAGRYPCHELLAIVLSGIPY